jgi:HEAT repeat protein
MLGKANAQVVENLNQFLANQNNYFRSGMAPDYPTLAACISAMAALGDGSSFPVLFSAMTTGYPQPITQAAISALESLQGNYKQYLIDVIRKNPPAEKFAAFRIGANNSRFTEAERGELAQTALEVTLDLFPGNAESSAAVSSLRYAAIQSLTQLKWTRASPLAIRHFYRVQTDYSTGAAPRERLLEAIACLGAMGNSESAQVLALQLGYFNSQKERKAETDDAVILALIQALGEIGDKVAFDYLLYISYLNYPEQIQAAAREALNRLKW